LAKIPDLIVGATNNDDLELQLGNSLIELPSR
jgi:hypothetical protein